MRPRTASMKVRTRAAAICADHFVRRADTGIASASRSQLAKPRKMTSNEVPESFMLFVRKKDMPVFAGSISFAVAVSEIAATGTDVNGMPQVCELLPSF